MSCTHEDRRVSVTRLTHPSTSGRYHCLHGIAERAADVIDAKVGNLAACPGVACGAVVPRAGTRLSLTIRNVANTRAPPRIILARK